MENRTINETAYARDNNGRFIARTTVNTSVVYTPIRRDKDGRFVGNENN